VGKVIDAPATPDLLKFVAQPGAFLVVLILPAFLQWLILRHWFPRAGWWIPASGVGWFLGFLLLSWGIAVADTQGETAFARVAVPAGTEQKNRASCEQEGGATWAIGRGWKVGARTGGAARHAGQCAE